MKSQDYGKQVATIFHLVTAVTPHGHDASSECCNVCCSSTVSSTPDMRVKRICYEMDMFLIDI